MLPPPPAVFSPLARAWLPGSEGLVVLMSLPGPGLRNSVLCTSGGLQSPVAKAPIRPLWSLCAPREEAQRKEWALRKPMEGHGLESEELGRCGGGGGQAAQGPKQRPGARQSLCGGCKEAWWGLGPLGVVRAQSASPGAEGSLRGQHGLEPLPRPSGGWEGSRPETWG